MVLIIVKRGYQSGDIALGTVEVKKKEYQVGDIIETRKGKFEVARVLNDGFHLHGYKID